MAFYFRPPTMEEEKNKPPVRLYLVYLHGPDDFAALKFSQMDNSLENVIKYHKDWRSLTREELDSIKQFEYQIDELDFSSVRDCDIYISGLNCAKDYVQSYGQSKHKDLYWVKEVNVQE